MLGHSLKVAGHGCCMVITNSLVCKEVNPTCPAFPSSPLEPVGQSPAVRANEMCSVLTHSARWDWDVLLHRSARTYKMYLNCNFQDWLQFFRRTQNSFHPGVAKRVSVCKN